MTQYIGPHTWERSDGRVSPKGETRVEPTEDLPDHVDVGTYNFDTGDCLGTARYTRKQATELRDALTLCLDHPDRT